MANLHIKHHWLGRLLASDPGRIRFQKAGKATISLISSVFTTLLILRLSGNSLLTPAIVSGMAGMMGIMIVMDETDKGKKITTGILGISAACGITTGSLLSGSFYYIDIVMILVIFSAFYFSRFGVRYFSICMIGFITVYISSVLQLAANQLPWFYMGIAIGIIYAFLYNFIIFKNSAQTLNRSMRSYHIQSNLTLNILIKAIQDSEPSETRLAHVEKSARKLRDYGRAVANDLNTKDVKDLWPGLETSQLRLYLFDTGMLIETLVDSVKNLKKADALEIVELRRILVWVIKSLRDARVLAQNYDIRNLQEAETAVQALRLVVRDLLNGKEKPKGWVFLIRRIESIANHVVEGAITIQQSLREGKIVADDQDEAEDDNDEEDTDDDKKELKPSTKKAYQAVVAGTIAIIIGQIISPTQPYWVLLTAFIVLLGTESIGRTYIKGFQRSFGTIIGAVLGFGLAKLISGHSAVELVLLFSVIFFAFYLVTVSYTIMSMFITMLIAFMYDILLGGVSFQLIGARVIDTIAGAVIAFAVSMIIFPKKTKDKVADSIDDYLDELKPYVSDYVRSFREDVYVKELADRAFTLDQKLQAVEDEASPLLNRPETIRNSGIARWITILTAINYYAKHLVASAYRGDFEYPDELGERFKEVEEKIDYNMETLRKLLKRTERGGILYNLKEEREQIERLAPSRDQSHRDLIHHLYYVWRINQSIVALGHDLGAEIK
ncbi:hypothetical protein CFK37_06855 [Virgibacillus phasianinus]|uniref:Integral membrane bound transporter domain-containing protein n=1 Tax=Virgibacillus phasianinus TaxID=2017483 RepID=A0A220U184_9BACI|nr:FUSC family protein [Virgibacillus phasianinus]ASK61898.1 hypothetical protein CFK37_06855 [Virgibacillus phasianinus]